MQPDFLQSESLSRFNSLQQLTPSVSRAKFHTIDQSRNQVNKSCLTHLKRDVSPLDSTNTSPIKLPKLKPRITRNSFNLTSTEFVQITARLEQKMVTDYKVVPNYPKEFEQRTRYTIGKDEGKHNFMDRILHQANQTIRPGAYNPVDTARFNKPVKDTRFAYSKAARMTFIDEIGKRESKQPSPADYRTERKGEKKVGNQSRQ